nr:DUF4364 family protein [Eubacterium sp.]
NQRDGEIMDKEYNPVLDFDAFTAGIEDGGLRSSSAISILVCYILANCEEKITAQNIIDGIVDGKIANYFEVSNAISKMIKKGHFKENENGYLEISKDCKFAVDIVEKDLPITIREKSIEMVRRLAEREINKKENKVEIVPENGYFKITMHVSDIDKDFMVLSLNVPTMAQAELIRDKFQQNPTEIYQNLINSIFN